MEKEKFTISAFTENKIGLLGRLATIFIRRHVNVESLSVSETEYQGISRFTIEMHTTRETAERLVAQISKIIEVLVAFLQEDENIVSTELAMYKVRLRNSDEMEKVVGLSRTYGAHIGKVDGLYIVLEKSGKSVDIHALYKALEPFEIQEFVRSGKLAIHKGMKDLSDYLPEDFIMKKKTA